MPPDIVLVISHIQPIYFFTMTVLEDDTGAVARVMDEITQNLCISTTLSVTKSVPTGAAFAMTDQHGVRAGAGNSTQTLSSVVTWSVIRVSGAGRCAGHISAAE